MELHFETIKKYRRVTYGILPCAQSCVSTVMSFYWGVEANQNSQRPGWNLNKVDQISFLGGDWLHYMGVAAVRLRGIRLGRNPAP